MKKNILKISFIAALAIAAGFTAYSSQESTDLSGVSLANVEALARGESGGDVVCYDYGHILCPYNKIWVDRVEHR